MSSPFLNNVTLQRVGICIAREGCHVFLIIIYLQYNVISFCITKAILKISHDLILIAGTNAGMCHVFADLGVLSTRITYQKKIRLHKDLTFSVCFHQNINQCGSQDMQIYTVHPFRQIKQNIPISYGSVISKIQLVYVDIGHFYF